MDVVSEFNGDIIEFKDDGARLHGIFPFTAALRKENPALVIDNGSWQIRAGWSTDSHPAFAFYNLLAKHKGKKGDLEPVFIGNDLRPIEALRWMVRSPFDGNVVVQYDYQEAIFDYVLASLGLSEEQKLEMPLVITEPLLNPLYCRKHMSELLFECYAFPHVAYGVDGAFSFYKNFQGTGDGIVINAGNVCTHIIPILNGQMDIGHARRIDLGGLNMTLYMQRLLQLKYPVHAASITISRMEEIVHGYCFFADNYATELAKWRSKGHHRSSVLYFQLPFQAAGPPAATQEEIDARREENAQRLREMNRKRRLEKLKEEEERREKLLNLQEQLNTKGLKQAKEELKALRVKSMEALQTEVAQLTSTIERTRERLEQKPVAEPNAASAEQPMDPETVAVYVADLKEQRHRLHEQKIQRKQRKLELGKRRSYASQQRMKILTQLASGRTGKKTKKEDTFGKNDEDWLVYREINKEAGESDSEEERMQMEEIESLLLKYDPVFRKEYEKSQAIAAGVPPKSPEYYRLEVGVERFRVPEILFQPSLVGIDEMGILDTLEYLFSEYPEDIQKRLVQNVFLTGGCTNLPGMDQRLQNELASCLPYDTPFNIVQAADSTDDAWAGASLWARNTTIEDGYLSKQMYLENGPGFCKEHPLSNKYRLPPVRPVEAAEAKKQSGSKGK
ncbi:actin-related protein 5-like [Paramacrobiotus metropolitanus]|uniref:actin-related protein 5-like n=1 Tax=Paramacrobiotus metropolitanus TaxID=2943436 RepID=UPI002445DF82|nr:actin-related protein 5-like [Paramacrobiotus metropolitanus]